MQQVLIFTKKALDKFCHFSPCPVTHGYMQTTASQQTQYRPLRGSNATTVPKRPVPMQSICPSLLMSMLPQFSSNIQACVYVVHSTALSFPRSAINAPKHGYVSPEISQSV